MRLLRSVKRVVQSGENSAKQHKAERAPLPSKAKPVTRKARGEPQLEALHIWIILFTTQTVVTRLHSQGGTHAKFASKVKTDDDSPPPTSSVLKGLLLAL